MHCDNPPCVRGCSFGALSKQPEGNTVIDHSLCFGVQSAGMFAPGAYLKDKLEWEYILSWL